MEKEGSVTSATEPFSWLKIRLRIIQIFSCCPFKVPPKYDRISLVNSILFMIMGRLYENQKSKT